MKNNEKIGCFGAVAVIVVFILAITNPVSLVVFSIFGIGIFLAVKKIKKDKRNKEAQELEDKRNKEAQELEDKRNAILNSKNYIYIKNFVEKYSGTSYENENINQLQELLFHKDVKINNNELEWILKKELEEKNYRYFKNKIHSCSPKEIEEYIHIFLDAFGESTNYTSSLARLLKDDGIQFDKNALNSKILEANKKIELERFEKKILANESGKKISIADLDSVTGYEFEYFLKDLFEKMGYKVENTTLSNDQGADLIVNKFGDKVSVQAKRYSGSVGNKAIQEVVASIKHYKADRGVVVTTNYFTQQAISLARSNNIELISRQELEKLVEKFY
jgi:restriction endonuclease Mrr